MITLAEVKMWGITIGALSLNQNSKFCSFEYSDHFKKSNIEVAPLMMPLSDKIYTFPNLSQETFSGLPGLIADSLPDKFGNALIDSWLASQGRSPESFNIIERLCYTGERGMGALEYYPTVGPSSKNSESLDLDNLINLASDALRLKHGLSVNVNPGKEEYDMSQILQVGTSAGGARAKALIAWNPTTNEIRSGQANTNENFEHWLLKFDGVSLNSDKEQADPQGYGVIEYAYHKMALKSGITMNECRLLKDNDRKHFMTRRFDRNSNGKKIHMQTLGAMSHLDFNILGVNSYEQAFLTCKKLNLTMIEQEELFRRMAFNIIARNQDDHVKNISFLMDKQGHWTLAPAYDITYNYNPDGMWTGLHQMSLNGKRENFTFDDFKQMEKYIGLKRGSAKRIITEVSTAVKKWPDIAHQENIPSANIEEIAKHHRLNII